jgi:hypothetical protein
LTIFSLSHFGHFISHNPLYLSIISISFYLTSALNSQLSTLNSQLSTPNSQLSTLNSQLPSPVVANFHFNCQLHGEEWE